MSDPYRIHVCENCGLMAIADFKRNYYECRNCSKNASSLNRKPNIYQVRIPYACKLLLQELMAMQLAPKIITKDPNDLR